MVGGTQGLPGKCCLALLQEQKWAADHPGSFRPGCCRLPQGRSLGVLRVRVSLGHAWGSEGLHLLPLRSLLPCRAPSRLPPYLAPQVQAGLVLSLLGT